MSEKVLVTCICHVEIEDVNEYEALTIVEDMLKREYPLSEKKKIKNNRNHNDNV